MSTRTLPANIGLSQANGHTDSASKAHAGSPFAILAVTGNAIQIHADGGIWDTVANKFLTTNDVKRNG